MNEPRVVESVTNECQSLGRAHESSSARADELIACLEGEIAKRDEELAACRVAVENCDLFRARIADLEALKDGLESDVARLREKNATFSAAWDELAAIKAQEPVAWAGAIEYGVPLLMVEPQNWKATPLYAAPASEAKAQGVVMPAELDRAFITGESCDGVYRVVIQSETLKEMQAVHSWLARLNATPVQQVSVPDERAAFEREDRYIVIKRSDMDRIPNQKVVHSFLGALGELSAHSVRIPQRKFLVIESDWPEYDPAWKLIQDRVQGRPILIAAPAAPAADAGIVDMYRHLQKVTPYRFKKIQDASITDGGDVMYFHKDRFDAALLADMAAHCAAKGVV